MLIAENIYLRLLESIDVDFILQLENNPENWEVSGTTAPFTKNEITDFVNSKHDIYQNQQIRYVICSNSDKNPIGTIDLFEFDEQRQSVGVGVIIAEDQQRNKGYASEALRLMVDYCRNQLSIVTMFCNIQKNNSMSIRLFEKYGFEFVNERTLDERPVNYYELKL